MNKYANRTVNVVTIQDNVVQSLVAFPDSTIGNQEAEREFKNTLALLDPLWETYSKEDIENILADGFILIRNCSICLVHSENLYGE